MAATIPMARVHEASRARDALSLEGVGVCAGGRWVLSDVTMRVERGEHWRIIGDNGAGKSTLLRVMAGLLRPTTGSVRAWGGGARALAGSVGYIAHEPMVYAELTVRENIEFFARMNGASSAAVRAAEMIERVGLSERAGEMVRTLSRGLQQRVAIARALVHEPGLIVADEPLAGLDARWSHEVSKLLHECVQAGAALILAEHGERSGVSGGAIGVASGGERVVVVADGRVHAMGAGIGGGP